MVHTFIDCSSNLVLIASMSTLPDLRTHLISASSYLTSTVGGGLCVQQGLLQQVRCASKHAP
jgi:hypothetical protein